MYTTTAYGIYIALSILITALVSRTLSKDGEVYLVDAFAN